MTIVTLLDQRAYSIASLNANPTDLIISLVYMMRANEESSTKSSRLRAAWAARRDQPGARFHGGQCPGWLKPNAARTGYDIIEERAAIVRRIYRDSLDGVGLQTIARDLISEHIPLFGRGNQRGKLWNRALIRHLLRTDLTIGTYTPSQAEIINGKSRYMPMEPRLGYYPPIIPIEDWQTVRNRRLAWSEHYGCVGRTLKLANILSRLAKCPDCGRPMVLMRTQAVNQRYLVCAGWREAKMCSDEWVRFPEIEDVFLSDIRFVIEACPQPVLHVETRRSMLKTISNRLCHLRSRLKRERDAHNTLNTNGRAGRTWAADTQEEMQRLLADRYRLRADRSYWQDATLVLKLKTLSRVVATDPPDLAAINQALRQLLTKVVVDWRNARLVLHWWHGGQTYSAFWRRRQRGIVRNVSPGPIRGRRPFLPAASEVGPTLSRRRG